MNTDKRTRKLELVARLLAKAESTTPEEAEALTAAAEKIMIEFQIERAELADADPASRQIVERLHPVPEATYSQARCWSLSLAIDALEQVSTYWRTNRATRRRVLVIVGTVADADEALRLAESLDRQQMHAMRAWWHREREYHGWSTEHEKLSERRGYLIGFGLGVAARIEAARLEATEGLAESTALVLAGNRAAVDEYLAQTKITPTRSRAPGSAAAQQDGYRDGQDANTTTDHDLHAPERLELSA